MKKGILYNTLSQLTAKVMSMSITVFVTMLVTRAFGKDGYGEFSLMQNLPALFFILADFGLNTAALKKIGKDSTLANYYYQNVLSLRLILSAVFIVLLNTITFFLPYSLFLKTGILMSSFLILTQSLYSSTNLIFQYKKRYDLSSIGYVAGYVITIIFIGLFITAKLDVRFLSFSYVLGGLITFFVNAILLKKHGYSNSLQLDPIVTKSILVSSLPLGLMFIFSQINFRADSIMLSLLKLPREIGLTNLESVAVYSLPYKVFEVALVLPTFFMNATYPFFITKWTQGKQEFINIFKKAFISMLLLGLVTSITLYITAPYAVQLLGGSQFAQSIAVLKILSIGLFIFFLTQPLSYFVVTLDKQKYLPPIYLISAIFNIVANLTFIPVYGFYASAYITWVSETIILLLLSVTAIYCWKNHNDAKI